MSELRIPAEKTATLEVRPVGTAVAWGARLQARQEARALLVAARTRAEQELRQAREQADTIRGQAAAEGLRQGHRRAAGALAAVARQRERSRRAAWPELVRLARGMAERILRAELRLRPQAVEDLCRQVLAEARLGSDVVIRVHPADLQRLERVRPDWARELGLGLQLLPSADVSPGGVLLVGEAGQVDARLEVQLEQLARAVLGGVDEDPD